MLQTVFNFKKLIYLEKELAVQLQSNIAFSNKNLKLRQTDIHNGICYFIFFLFPFFAMLTQHIQLHHGFNSTSNTTKQNPNVHLLYAPSKLRLTP
jgi:hypothetical protein